MNLQIKSLQFGLTIVLRKRVMIKFYNHLISYTKLSSNWDKNKVWLLIPADPEIYTVRCLSDLLAYEAEVISTGGARSSL